MNKKIQKELLHQFIETAQKQFKIPKPEQAWPPELTAAIPYIHQHLLDNDLKVSKLKKVIYGCNGNDFSTNFSYYIGVPPSVYINDLRIEIAKGILSEKRFYSVNISTVAKILGFSGKGNFHHAFRKREGVSPDEWRERNVNGKVKRIQQSAISK